MLLILLGFRMVEMIATGCDIPYNRALKVILGIRKVACSSEFYTHVEYTKELRELVDKQKIDLQC